MDWQDKLIHLYVSICQQYHQKHLWFYTERMSPNDTPTFTDEEVLTIYLFGIMQQHTQIKAIYTYTKDHLCDWFPHLPSYAGYIRRLNRLAVVFALHFRLCFSAASSVVESLGGGLRPLD